MLLGWVSGDGVIPSLNPPLFTCIHTYSVQFHIKSLHVLRLLPLKWNPFTLPFIKNSTEQSHFKGNFPAPLKLLPSPFIFQLHTVISYESGSFFNAGTDLGFSILVKTSHAYCDYSHVLQWQHNLLRIYTKKWVSFRIPQIYSWKQTDLHYKENQHTLLVLCVWMCAFVYKLCKQSICIMWASFLWQQHMLISAV